MVQLTQMNLPHFGMLYLRPQEGDMDLGMVHLIVWGVGSLLWKVELKLDMGAGFRSQLNKAPKEALEAEVKASTSALLCLLRASQVCRKWREEVQHALMFRVKLSFSGWRVDDNCVARLVEGAYRLQELDMESLGQLIVNLFCDDTFLIGGFMAKLGGLGVEIVVILRFMVSLQVSRATSLQHLNIGGTFITEISIFAISKCCQKLKVLNLWGCRHVSGNGLLALGSGCPNLSSINVWGLRIPFDLYSYLLSINPNLHLKIGSVQLAQHWQTVH
ncbi:hypothetical protein L7F22_011052 [Adiantum nelumboides]|nr:hypothetical protein [Adiantum nelumboides]